MIRFRVHSPECSVIYEMPYSEEPIAMLGNLPADMLQGARMFIGGFDPHPNAQWVTAFVPPAPKEPKRKGKK